MNNKRLLLGMLLTFALTSVQAKITLPSFYSDNMVLQQQTTVTLTGKANKNTSVRVSPSWNKETYRVKSDASGSWTLQMPTPVAGGPYDIRLSDGEERTLKNVLIGEVWFCSGQSNMHMPMSGVAGQPIEETDEYIMKARPSKPIRMFTVGLKDGEWSTQASTTPKEDCVGEWLTHTPAHVAQTSAVGYFFAHYLQESLDVPVGIIVSARGSAKIEPWISRETLSKIDGVDLSVLDNYSIGTNDSKPPCVLYNAGIAPFRSYTIKGFLWYQGESNVKEVDHYAPLLHAFVGDMRNLWKNDKLPFYCVEIAPYMYEGVNKTNGAKMRQVQQQCMDEIPHCGLVTNLDLGHPVFIHPQKKRTVGKRLALWALCENYGMKGIDYKTPIYDSMKIEGDKIRINVKNAGRGIGPLWCGLEGFEIAGEDRVFHKAHAHVVGNVSHCIEVRSEEVPHPVAVRYAFKNYATSSVYNSNHIPLASFRTDNW